MTNYLPLISVVIPCYNYAASLERAVVSVMVQVGEDCDLWLIDDGSSDATPQVAAALQARWPNRCHYQRQDNAGPAAARNRGMALSQGRWLLFLDADDELLPNALATFRAAVRDTPAAVILAEHLSVNGAGKAKHHRQKPLPESPLQRLQAYLLDKSLHVCHGAVLLHRDVFAAYRYPERFRTAEDQPLFAYALANFPCALVRTATVRTYRHSASLRNQTHTAIGLQPAEEIFDPRRLQPALMALKPAYTARRHLSLFRTLAQADRPRAAWTHYVAAVCLLPGTALRPRYWGKALRAGFACLLK